VLYRVRIGEDVYIGTPEEVVEFMRRAKGAPPGDASAYMRAVASRIARDLGVDAIDPSGPTAFLESLRRSGVVGVEAFAEPDTRRTDPDEALGDGPVVYGEGVDPEDIP
jgi:hypothetical protein